ncbi:MAG TPA: phosphatase domain-containing protein [Thermoanaerobaculia bacterium]|nr:phosphatase domain-containing protein [Thermoanaerobaculia bacterium]
MKERKGRVLDLVSRIEGGFDRLKNRVAERFDRDDPLQILPYRGFGTAERLIFQGRILQDEPVGTSSKGDTVWKNLGNMWKRFESDELPGVKVQARLGSWSWETVTDDEGYFRFDVRLPSPLTELAEPGRLWYEVALEMRDPRSGLPVRGTAPVLVPAPGAELGVISDIDDTVVETGVTNRLAMARTVFLHNAHTRLPFQGVAAFYKALHQGRRAREGRGANPVFFVSGSPWNLYDLLAEFMDLHEIPRGPLMLRDFGFDRDKLLHTETREHKLACIRPILELYPALSFVLIGDSGEQDPEIYREVVREFPGRVRAIYIRNVATRPARENEVLAIAREVREEGVPMLLVKDTEAASVHALAEGWIRPEKLPEVRQEKLKDQAAPSPAEVALSTEA